MTAAGLAQALRACADASESADAPLTIGALIDGLAGRAFGAALFTLALPCAPPFLYMIPQIVALPILALTAQMASGRAAPWLPARLRARRIDPVAFGKALDRAERLLGWLERTARQRPPQIRRGPARMAVGAVLTLFGLSVLVPLPGTNTVPGVAIAIVGFGLAEEDGILVLIGLALGSLWIAGLAAAAAGLAHLAFG